MVILIATEQTQFLNRNSTVYSFKDFHLKMTEKDDARHVPISKPHFEQSTNI